MRSRRGTPRLLLAALLLLLVWTGVAPLADQVDGATSAAEAAMRAGSPRVPSARVSPDLPDLPHLLPAAPVDGPVVFDADERRSPISSAPLPQPTPGRAALPRGPPRA